MTRRTPSRFQWENSFLGVLLDPFRVIVLAVTLVQLWFENHEAVTTAYAFLQRLFLPGKLLLQGSPTDQAFALKIGLAYQSHIIILMVLWIMYRYKSIGISRDWTEAQLDLPLFFNQRRFQ